MNTSDSLLANSISMSQDSTKPYVPENFKVFMDIYPSDGWIDSMQHLNGENGWNIVVDDNEYYRNLTNTLLERKGYVRMEVPLEKKWRFNGANCVVKFVDSDTMQTKWGTLIFDGRNEPFFYNGTEPGDDLKDL